MNSSSSFQQNSAPTLTVRGPFRLSGQLLDSLEEIIKADNLGLKLKYSYRPETSVPKVALDSREFDHRIVECLLDGRTDLLGKALRHAMAREAYSSRVA